MRPRWWIIWLTVSLVLNALLFVAWLRELRPTPLPTREVVRRPIVTNILRPLRTNVVLQPRILSWSDLESEDYPTYVRNLRGIGCPPETVRDIVLADVNALFARRRQTEVPSPFQWWRLGPDPELREQFVSRTQALEAERRQLLTQLLGPDWDRASAEDQASAAKFAGPVLGGLSPEVRRQVGDIERQYQQRLEALIREANSHGETLSPTARAHLVREVRAQLAAVLSPEQLEEYLLRSSATAGRLRQQLDGLDVTPDQFRRLFRAADTLEAQLAELGEATDAASQRRRTELQAELERTYERELGTDVYLRQRLNQDSVFRQTWETAERAGVPAEKVLPFYQLNQVTVEERQRVLADRALTPEEQTRQLAELYEHRLAALRTLLGEEAFLKLQAEAPD